jgi:hypothetical protein
MVLFKDDAGRISDYTASNGWGNGERQIDMDKT